MYLTRIMFVVDWSPNMGGGGGRGNIQQQIFPRPYITLHMVTLAAYGPGNLTPNIADPDPLNTDPAFFKSTRIQGFDGQK